MNERITNVEVKEFLKDYRKNSKTMILEEGREKNELLESARKRGIIISKNDKDLGVIKTIYCFTSKANSNKMRVPKDEFIKIFPQIVGRPMNNCHDRKFILGFYIDYKYILKSEKAIAYAIFFKSAYPKLWKKAKEFQKKNRLSSSYEIWSPEEKRKQLSDGTEELHDMAIAGGALIFEEYGDEPAFKDAKVLSLSSKQIKGYIHDECLVYASKYKENEIITSAGEMTLKKVEIEKPTNTKVVIPSPTIRKIKCSNCSGELEHNGIDIKIKCPKCFAILNKDGVMQYPPQIKDFRLLCPACKVNNWLIVSKNEDKAKVRCQSCAKEYNLTFAIKKSNELINKTQFLYTSKLRCLQCHTTIYVSGTSAVKTRDVECKKCGLNFSYDITHERYKKISQIEEVIPNKENKIDNKKESSEKGGQKMAKEKKVEKASGKKIEVKKEVKVEPKKEVKIEEKKVEAKAKIEAPKKVETEVEKKVEAKETPKAEKTPKTAEKVEESKAKEKPEAKAKEVKVKEEKAKEKPEAKKEAKKTPKAEEPKVEPKIEKKEVKVKEKKTEATEKKTITEVAKEASEEASKEKVKSVIKVETPKEEKLTEARFEYEVNNLDEILEDVKPAKIEESARLTTEQRNALPDSMFAVVVKVKDKRTGKTRKIRMYPINDKAHVRNALARLGQPRPKATLKRLGVSIEAVRAKILRRARQLKMTQLLERYKKGIRKIANKVKELRKEKASLEKKVKLYADNAKTIIERREELGDYSKDISDEDILNDDKFGKVKAEKENTILRAKNESDGNEIVGSKVNEKSDEWYKNKRKAIDKVAFKRD